MKRCALILSGFLRDEENINKLKVFLRNNSHYDIDVYANIYELIGLPTKLTAGDVGRVKRSPLVPKDVFCGLGVPTVSLFQNFERQKLVCISHTSYRLPN